MSADSPRRGLHKGAQVISPQPISDRSIIDSVAGIINDIVPQAYTGAPNSDNKESITWARFEYADVNNAAFYPDYIEGSATPPLLLVLGYTTGVQVWVVAASGEATEVLSWRQGIVRTLRILPDPKTDEDHADPFESKRPLVAICDSAGPGPQFCNVSFISLRTSEQTKSIKFKNPVCDVLANGRSVVVTFSEKIAVFDARTLEDVLTVTTCYPSPGPNPNPVALGTRWLAYSEKKLLPARRSSGGSEGEGVQSYTATVLYAAKSLGKGLRGLGETVASSLTGNSVTPMAINSVGGDVSQPGVVTILDLQAAKEEKEHDDPTIETVVAHFTAHNDAIVAITFDLTGALLMTADKRGHDFHVFRIQPHPGGPTLAAVHHLYVLHRGDTTAKVQDMTFSSDTRWAAVSTVRGTTHVFPVAPYGGPVGVRTHSTPHVVNRLSRFHRSAGLTDDGTRSHSPVSHAELPLSVYPYSNPRLPPYPHPTILHPLAQIRQPSTLNHSNSQPQPSRPQQRQRLHSEDSGTLPLKICACFAPPRAWIYAQRDSTSKVAKRAVDSLFIMACHGNMIQYDLEPKPAAGVPKEKVCDDTTIELEVEAKGQWPLLRTPNSLEIVPPLPSSSPLLCTLGSPKNSRHLDTADDRWLSQVEIVTHAGPHRRLWMGPQFVFKTYNAPSGVNLVESEAIEIGVTGGSRPARSNPVNMPHAATRPLMPVVIDGSGSSYEQSPRFMEAYGDSLDNDTMGIGNGENQLREDLAEAMLETSAAPHRAAGRRLVVERVGQPVTKVVNPLGTVITVLADEEDVSSGQEFDDATPEPPRSVCAEEGPASLGDFDTEAPQELRNLTEICAEMRSASEPAIDSVPDESIRDVKERKSLCVEAASTSLNPGGASNTIDFERAEAFRDVPTSLSLCAERGEIPSSPMTQARENTWKKRTAKREDSELQERTFAKAKYVVSYDEDSVVLMEKKATGKIDQQQQQQQQQQQPEDRVASASSDSGKDSPRLDGSPKKPEEPERASSKRPSKLASSARATKRSTCGVRERPKYLVHEREDSVVIEDTTMPPPAPPPAPPPTTTTTTTKLAKKIEMGKNDEGEKTMLADTTSERVEPTARDKRKDRRRDSKNSSRAASIDEAEAMVVESRDADETIGGVIGSFVDLKDMQVPVDEDVTIPPTMVHDPEPMEATVATGSANAPVLDDISCMDYHIVEAHAYSATKETPVYSHQSDDDIEHIHSSEVTQMLEIIVDDRGERNHDDFSVSPMRQRKSSKSTISDDDLEHINSAELAEVIERASAALNVTSKTSSHDRGDLDDFQRVAKLGRSVLAFDDDVEHVYHSEVTEPEATAMAPTIEAISPKSTGKKSQEVSAAAERTPSLRSRGSRKRKDVVVIDSDTSEAEVTVIVKSLDGWNKSKTPEKDLAEEIDRCVEPKDHFSDQTTSQSLPKKTRVRTAKIATGATGAATTTTTTTTTTSASTVAGAATVSKRPQQLQQQQQQPACDMIEIIDIDAMQKAEMEVASECASTPECKILEARHDPPATRSQKSRKARKSHLESAATGTQVEAAAMESASVAIREQQQQQQCEQELQQQENAERGAAPPITWSSLVRTAECSTVEAEVSQQDEVNLTTSKIAAEAAEAPDFAATEANAAATTTEISPTPPDQQQENSPGDSRVASKTPSSADVAEKTSKKRGKKTRGSGVEQAASSSPVKNIPVEVTAPIVENPPSEEPARRAVTRTRAKQATTAVTVVDETTKDGGTTTGVEAEDVKMSEQADDDWKYQESALTEITVASTTTTTKEEESTPEEAASEQQKQRQEETEPEKRNDSDQENQPERSSSSSDDLNANVVPMDTEEDGTAVREIAEKNGGGSTGASPSWSTVNKKNTRSKKKKRR